MAPTALRSLLSKSRRASASEIDSPAATFSKMSRSSLCSKMKFMRQSSPEPKPAVKDHFRQRHHQKNRTDESVEPKKGGVNPVKASPLRQPVFQQQAPQNDKQPHEIRHSKM